MEEDKLREAVLRAIQKLEKRRTDNGTTDKQRELLEKDERSCLMALTGDMDHEQVADLILQEYIKNKDEDKKENSHERGERNS